MKVGYHCNACQHNWGAEMTSQQFDDNEPQQCPECESFDTDMGRREERPKVKINVKVSGAAPALKICWYRCVCEHLWEVKLTPEEQDTNAPQECPSCGRFVHDEYVGSIAPPKVIVRGNHDYSERERQRLYDRSSEQFRKEGRDEAIERQRAQFKREGLVP